MSRSLKKGPFVDGHLLDKVQKHRDSGQASSIKTWSRRSTILPTFMDLTFMVHTGKRFIPVHITETMIGHKLGEFAPTRKFVAHSGNKKASK